MSDATDQIVEIEKGFWTQADDSGYFQEHMAEGGLSVMEPMGFIEKKQAMEMTAEKPWKTVTMDDLQVRQVTPECVILTYHGTGHRDGDAKPYQGSIASTYVRDGGRWLLALTSHQPWIPKDGIKNGSTSGSKAGAETR
jgi:hypothetical protein